MCEAVKKCTICAEVKPVSDYYIRSARCKSCYNTQRNKYSRKSYYVKKGYKHRNEENYQKVREMRANNMKWVDISKALAIPYVSLMLMKPML